MKKQSSFVLGTFYTKDTPYVDVFSKFFLPSAMQMKRNYDLDWKVSAIENEGSWIKNVAQKPLVILNMLNTIEKDKNLVFLDSDATIEVYPDLFNEIKEDIAVHYLDWSTWYKNGSDRKELLSGTMFFKNNGRVRDLLLDWHNKAQSTTEWEQVVLEKILNTPRDLTIYKLSVEYCYIKTLPTGQQPHVFVENPIIVHNQVSRQLKKIVNM